MHIRTTTMHFKTALRLCALMGAMALAGACTTE